MIISITNVISMSSNSDDNSALWTRAEKKLWGFALTTGGIAIYAARFATPVCTKAIAKEFGWSKTTSGTMLSSFFWGYAMTQIIGGYQSDKVGGEIVMFVAGSVWALMTFWFPFFLDFLDFKSPSSYALTCVTLYRVIYGAAQGLHFPATVTTISSYLLQSEKTFFTSVVFSGGSLGIILCGLASSWITTYLSWRYVFIMIGAISLAWVMFLRYLITYNQKKSNVVSLKSNVSANHGRSKEMLAVPLSRLVKHKSFWALIVAHYCHANSWFLIFSWTPYFFQEKFPETPAYVYSSIPYMISTCTSVGIGYFANFLIKHGYSMTTVRKIIHTMSQTTVAFSLFFIARCESSWVAILCMCLTVAGGSFSHASTLVNAQDLLPDHAGSLFGIMNTAGAIPGFIGVYICGYILETTGSWQYVFNTTVLINIFGLIVFIAFGSARKIDLHGKGEKGSAIINT